MPPQNFDECVRRGGKVRTVSGPSKEHGLDKDEYVRYCVHNGRSYRSYVEKKEDKGKSDKE